MPRKKKAPKKAPPRVGRPKGEVNPNIKVNSAWWKLLDKIAEAEAESGRPRHLPFKGYTGAAAVMVRAGILRFPKPHLVAFTDAGRSFYAENAPDEEGAGEKDPDAGASGSLGRGSAPEASAASTVIEAELVEDGEIIDAEVVEHSPSSAETALVPTGPAGAIVSLDEAPSAARVLATWLADKHAKSVEAYRGDLGYFAAWWHGQLKTGEWDPERGVGSKVPSPLIGSALQGFMRLSQPNSFARGLEYRTWLQKTRKLAPNTINRRLAALRSYVKLAKQVGACPWDLEVPNVSAELVRDVAGPGAAGYAELVEAAEAKVAEAEESGNERSRKTWVRNVALLRLYHDAGLRRMEPLNIDYPKDVDLRRRGEERLRFRRKKRTQKAWFDIGSRRAVKAIKAWLKIRGTEPGPLFISLHHGHHGKRLAVRTINKIITDQLGGSIDLDVTPHGLRHTSATTLLDKTEGDVRAVAEFLGHKGLGTVQQYDDARKKQAKRMGSLHDDED